MVALHRSCRRGRGTERTERSTGLPESRNLTVSQKQITAREMSGFSIRSLMTSVFPAVRVSDGISSGETGPPPRTGCLRNRSCHRRGPIQQPSAAVAARPGARAGRAGHPSGSGSPWTNHPGSSFPISSAAIRDRAQKVSVPFAQPLETIVGAPTTKRFS